MINHSEKDLLGYKQIHDRKMQGTLDEANGRIKNPGRAPKIAKMDQNTDSYQAVLEKLIASSTMFSNPLGRK